MSATQDKDYDTMSKEEREVCFSFLLLCILTSIKYYVHQEFDRKEREREAAEQAG